MQTKKNFLIVLILLFAFSFIKLYPNLFPTLPFSLNIDKQEAIHIADTFLKNKGYSTENYKKSIDFQEASYTSYFLQDIGKFEESRQIFGDKFIIWFWEIRYLIPLEKEEFRIRINPESGEIIHFNRIIPEDKKATSLSKEKALDKAHEFLLNQNIIYADLTQLDYTEKKQLNRIDHHYSLGNILPDFKNSKIQYDISIYGNTIGKFNVGITIPEAYTREYNKKTTTSSIFGLINIILTILLFIATFIYLVILSKKGEDFLWKNSLILSLLLLIFPIVNFLNNISRFWMSYDTSLSLKLSFTITSLILFFTFLLFTLGFLLIFAVGEKLSNTILAKNSVSFLQNYKYLKSKQLGQKVLIGYLTGCGILIFASLFYFTLQKYTKIWIFTSPVFSEAVSGKLPFIIPLSTGIIAAFLEEFLFRGIGMSVIKKIFKYTWIAVIISSVIWGIGHVTINILPSYIRIIEVTLIGIILALIFLKFGIESVITAHFFVNSFLVSTFFINSGMRFSGNLAIFFTFLPLLLIFLNNKDIKSIKE